MRKVLLLLGATMLVGLMVSLSGCIIQTTEITIVVTDYVCTGFEEDHNSENYTDETVTFDDDFFQELDAIIADNDLSKDDVEDVEVVGVYYQVVQGPTNPPWTVSGRIWIEVDGGGPVLLATYQSVVLTGPMTEPIAVSTEDAGKAALNAALQDYLDGGYPDIVFTADRETGDISPTPTLGSPFVMTWNGCVSMRVDFVEEYDVYDLFPGE